MKLKELDIFFKESLNINETSKYDKAINGLQVGSYEQEINKIAFAVDASAESIDEAIKNNVDLLFVHHGFFWGKQFPITNINYDRISKLIKNNIALYAVHIPLDMHELYGNNIQLAKQLKLSKIKPFGFYNGAKIGFKGELKTKKNIDFILETLGKNRDNVLSVLDFGVKDIKSIGIVSGGAPFDVEQAISENLDLFITGDCAHEIYHLCKEAKINMISCGHYSTETYGVMAVKKLVEEKLNLKTIFLNIDTKL